jgi:hypothetical protein
MRRNEGIMIWIIVGAVLGLAYLVAVGIWHRSRRRTEYYVLVQLSKTPKPVKEVCVRARMLQGEPGWQHERDNVGWWRICREAMLYDALLRLVEQGIAEIDRDKDGDLAAKLSDTYRNREWEPS